MTGAWLACDLLPATGGSHWHAVSELGGLLTCCLLRCWLTCCHTRLVSRLVTRLVASSQGQRAWLAGQVSGWGGKEGPELRQAHGSLHLEAGVVAGAGLGLALLALRLNSCYTVMMLATRCT